MISVVIPAYNAEDTIIDCLHGVLEQTRADLIEEILIIDDGSKDNTVEVINSNITDNRVKVISKENGGVSTARNLGIKTAKAEWIALLDSDDVWKPNKIEKQIEAIKKYPDISFIGANRNAENVKMGKRIEGNLYSLTLRNILVKNWPHTSTALIKKSVFDEVGLFDYIDESLESAGGNK